MENGLRDLVTVRADGGVRTGADVVKLALLGAEEFGFGTVAMVAAGCVMARVCHTNNCPVGVATQKEKLRARVRGEPEDVTRYFESVAEETADILKKLGLKSLREAVGRIDLLELLDDMSLSKTTRFDVATTVLKPVQPGLFTQDFVAPANPHRRARCSVPAACILTTSTSRARRSPRSRISWSIPIRAVGTRLSW